MIIWSLTIFTSDFEDSDFGFWLFHDEKLAYDQFNRRKEAFLNDDRISFWEDTGLINTDRYFYYHTPENDYEFYLRVESNEVI